MKVTLADVAKEAGVSRATVDRVLNERGNVRSATVDRVYRALYSTNYLLEPIGTEDSKPASYHFDLVVPVTPSDTRFSDKLLHELDDLSPHFSQTGVEVKAHCIENHDLASFAKQLMEIGESSDGIAFIAPEHPAVKNAINSLWERDVGCVTLVSDIPGTSRLGYSGVNNRAAGRTAGLLMGRFLGNREHGKVAVFTGSHNYRGNEEREAGFKSMIRERFPHLEIIVMRQLHHDDNRLSQKLTRSLLEDQTDIVGIYNDVGGGSVGIADALIAAGREQEIVFIAHELNPATRSYMIDGSIDVIIDQGLRHQVYNAVEMLLHHKRHQGITEGILQPQFEIYVAENIV